MYDSRQMNRMRQEAIRRSQEMHSRASGGNADIPPDKPPAAPPVQNAHAPNNRATSDISAMLGSLLGGGIGIDRDRLLIGALLLMLAREGADIKLILALGYILL